MNVKIKEKTPLNNVLNGAFLIGFVHFILNPAKP